MLYLGEKKASVSYPKFLVEVALGRLLDPQKETIDHIDGDFTNNSWDNMRIVPISKHVSQDNYKYVTTMKLTCPMCGTKFTIRTSKLFSRLRAGMAGPFCSRQCAGKHAVHVQNGGTPMRVNKHILDEYNKNPDKFRYEKHGGVLVSDFIMDPSLTEESIMMLFKAYQKDVMGYRSMAERKRDALKRHEALEHKRIAEERTYTEHIKKETELHTSARRTQYTFVCAQCGKTFWSHKTDAKYCSRDCVHIADKGRARPHRRKVERPSKEKLLELLRSTSMVKIGKKFGVSDNAVRKWCKSYEIDYKNERGKYKRNK